ncbi:MAG TPA: DUF2339 domain-containing protein [Steroidobacteraceae bacterium]|nr:DUF2339 domain-containing protein [Steroidobacteraceae bacterium]
MVRGYFIGGNTLVRAGVIVLFFGVAFLLRYAAEHSTVPIEYRLTGVVVGALALLALGWRLRLARAGYALALQGGAVGILYMTIFAALRLYSVLPAALAFPLLIVVAAISAALAVLQNSQSFALLAVIGGFLAPILASNGSGSHVALFSYYVVLNGGILSVSWFKAWRPLNVAGFAFTFVIGTAWGVLQYRATDFPTTEPFLIIFFLFYVGIAVLFTLRQPVRLRGYVDGTLVFGAPIAAFGLQSSLLHHRLFELAFSAVAMSALYLGLAWILQRRDKHAQRVLIDAFLALGVAFFTLAIPLALGSRMNSVTWALEGCALIWIGCRQNRLLPRVFGVLLIVAAGCVLAGEFRFISGHVGLSAGTDVAVVLLTAIAILAARMLATHMASLRRAEMILPGPLFFWGLFWWVCGGVAEAGHYVPGQYLAATLLLFAALTALAASEIERRLALSAARAAALLLLPLLLIAAVYWVGTSSHPFADGGWAAWPVSVAALVWIARRHEGGPDGALAKLLHVSVPWLLCALASWEAAWSIRSVVAGSETWPAVASAIVPALALFAIPRLTERVAWPFALHRHTYWRLTASGLALYLALWSLATNWLARGDARPLPYFPLLNPLDVAEALILMTLARHWLRARAEAEFARVDPRLPPIGFAALTFVWLNGVLLRTLHQWFAVPFELPAFMSSTLTQTSISVFWAALALTTMLVAARRRLRSVWLGGAALMCVVVAKLFLVDLSSIGSIARIVSFVAVGLLMLIVGYFSPLPPRRELST